MRSINYVRSLFARIAFGKVNRAFPFTIYATPTTENNVILCRPNEISEADQKFTNQPFLELGIYI